MNIMRQKVEALEANSSYELALNKSTNFSGR